MRLREIINLVRGFRFLRVFVAVILLKASPFNKGLPFRACEQSIRRQNLFVRCLLNGVIETICSVLKILWSLRGEIRLFRGGSRKFRKRDVIVPWCCDKHPPQSTEKSGYVQQLHL